MSTFAETEHAWLARSAAMGAVLLAAAVSPAIAASEERVCGSGEAPIGGNCRPVAEIADEVRAVVEEGVADLALSAALIEVRIGDVEVISEAFGTSMTGIPATTDMHFRNGAVAIAYLSTVLLRMQEDGLLTLEDRLSKWFPDYPKADEITLEMLISSTSGYADYVNLDYLPLNEDPFRQFGPDDLIAIAFGRDMACDPGRCFNYAHTNFVILGEVLSQVAGKPLEALISDYVLEPLGLENTRSEHTAVIQKPVLHAFTTERGVFEDSTYWNPSWTLARGAVMTTDLADLMASAIAIGTGSLLSDQSFAAQIAAGKDDIRQLADGVHYGMGVVVAHRWILQTPSFAGYAATMAYHPDSNVALGLVTTDGAGTPEAPRPTDAIFAQLSAYLVPGKETGLRP